MTITTLLDEIEKPTLLLDKDKAIKNISRMVAKAESNGVTLRPHFKTHQSAEVGNWFRKAGVKQITVSSADMAAYFADHGWHDITIAFPANYRQLNLINELAAKIQLNLLLESADVIDKFDAGLKVSVGAWLKIDSGYHRTGIDWREPEKVGALAERISQSRMLRLQGILTHAGDTYSATSEVEVADRYSASTRAMAVAERFLKTQGFQVAISVGDTPGCSIVTDLGGVDEIRPGNFIFFDLMQEKLGSCRAEDIAVAVACPIVAKHEKRSELVIYGGAIHFSKEFLRDEHNKPNYGQVARVNRFGWGRLYDASRLSSLSQEHGLIAAEDALLDEVSVGDVIVIIPVHSCLTANLLGSYLTLGGERIAMASYP